MEIEAVGRCTRNLAGGRCAAVPHCGIGHCFSVHPRPHSAASTPTSASVPQQSRIAIGINVTTTDRFSSRGQSQPSCCPASGGNIARYDLVTPRQLMDETTTGSTLSSHTQPPCA